MKRWQLDSGERQTAASYEAIRADHRVRYELADQRIGGNTFGLDCFCGNGYGTWLLANRGRVVTGIDGSDEAIIFARDHYFLNDQTVYRHDQFPFELPERVFDFVVSLESIEHVATGPAFFGVLARSLKPGGLFVFSTPCEDELPFNPDRFTFHHRHYRLGELFNLAEQHGLKIETWYGQNVYRLNNGRVRGLLDASQMILIPKLQAQFITMVVSRPASNLLVGR